MASQNNTTLKWQDSIKRDYRQRISQDEWSTYHQILREMHESKATRNEMLQKLDQDYDFRPSKGQLETQMIKWGLTVYEKQPRSDRGASVSATNGPTTNPDSTPSASRPNIFVESGPPVHLQTLSSACPENEPVDNTRAGVVHDGDPEPAVEPDAVPTTLDLPSAQWDEISVCLNVTPGSVSPREIWNSYSMQPATVHDLNRDEALRLSMRLADLLYYSAYHVDACDEYFAISRYICSKRRFLPFAQSLLNCVLWAHPSHPLARFIIPTFYILLVFLNEEDFGKITSHLDIADITLLNYQFQRLAVYPQSSAFQRFWLMTERAKTERATAERAARLSKHRSHCSTARLPFFRMLEAAMLCHQTRPREYLEFRELLLQQPHALRIAIMSALLFLDNGLRLKDNGGQIWETDCSICSTHFLSSGKKRSKYVTAAASLVISFQHSRSHDKPGPTSRANANLWNLLKNSDSGLDNYGSYMLNEMMVGFSQEGGFVMRQPESAETFGSDTGGQLCQEMWRMFKRKYEDLPVSAGCSDTKIDGMNSSTNRQGLLNLLTHERVSHISSTPVQNDEPMSGVPMSYQNPANLEGGPKFLEHSRTLSVVEEHLKALRYLHSKPQRSLVEGSSHSLLDSRQRLSSASAMTTSTESSGFRSFRNLAIRSKDGRYLSTGAKSSTSSTHMSICSSESWNFERVTGLVPIELDAEDEELVEAGPRSRSLRIPISEPIEQDEYRPWRNWQSRSGSRLNVRELPRRQRGYCSSTNLLPAAAVDGDDGDVDE